MFRKKENEYKLLGRMCEWCFNLGKRKRGRPHKVWRDDVEDELNEMEITVARNHQK
jgi:hypothetical protein